ncbi:MAG: class I SAM-dependent methyltransferase [Gemmatimonadaceae bacterium]
MDVREAAALIAPAVPEQGGTWADLGAGTGTFTRALASLLGPEGHVYAVDRDRASVEALRGLARRAADRAAVTAVHADFARTLELPRLDGALVANALHFVPDREQADVLGAIVRHLRPGGRLVVVEYEGRAPTRWVPFPVSLSRLREVAGDAGLGAPTLVGSRRSAFGGTMYAAYAATPEGTR